MKPGAKSDWSGYLYEAAWILPSIAVPVGMMAALLVTAYGAGIQLPTHEGRIPPNRILETPPFDKLGVAPAATRRASSGRSGRSPRTRSASPRAPR
jgi:hypothetical protein